MCSLIDYLSNIFFVNKKNHQCSLLNCHKIFVLTGIFSCKIGKTEKLTS